MRLFDEAALRKLEQLTLAADSVRVGALKGNRRSHKRGASIEFADYRDYAQGDDLRRLDWNVFARLERPFIKLTQDEEDLAVHILVDTSDSMNWPPMADESSSPHNKLKFALQLAGALGYIGLLSGDLVYITLINGQMWRSWGPFRGRQNGWPMIQFLEANFRTLIEPRVGGKLTTTLDVSLREYALRAQRSGLIFLISDLLTSGDFREGLTPLLSRGYEIALLHTLCPDETAPALSGDLRLIDVETGEIVEVSLDPQTLDDYLERLFRWQNSLETYSRQRGIHYSAIVTDLPWERIITHGLRLQGVIK